MEITMPIVFWAALITALATGLGAVPFFFVRRISHSWVSLASAIAAGLMLGASHGLIAEGIAYSLGRSILGIGLGIVFMLLIHRLLEGQKDLHIGALEGADALKAFLIVGVMTLHSFAEGVGVGVSFGGGEVLGGLITTAVAVHNIPEGLAISVILVPRGVPAWRSALWSIFSSLPQPLMAIPAFLFVTAFAPLLPVGLGFAAGAMIWMVFADLIPDALQDTSRTVTVVTVALSLAAMIAFQNLITG